MNIREWRSNGFPFNMRDHDPQDRGRASRFLANVAVRMGCDIDPDQVDLWQRNFRFARVIDNMTDRDNADRVDPESVWEDEYAGDESLVNIKNRFQDLMKERHRVLNVHKLIDSRMREVDLMIGLYELPVADDLTDQVANSRRDFNDFLRDWFAGACMFDDLCDLSKDCKRGIHQVKPDLLNRAVLSQCMTDFCMKGLIIMPKASIPQVVQMAAANTLPSYSKLVG